MVIINDIFGQNSKLLLYFLYMGLIKSKIRITWTKLIWFVKLKSSSKFDRIGIVVI